MTCPVVPGLHGGTPLSDALVIIDADGRYIDGNARALDLLGVSLEELGVDSGTELLHKAG